MKRRLAAVFGSRHRSGHSDIASSQGDDASTARDDNPRDDTHQTKQTTLSRPKSSFFRSLSRRAQPPAGPLITLDGDHPSSSSSSSAGPSTPDDDARSFVRAKTFLFQTDAAPPTQTAVHVQASLIVPQTSGIDSLHAARLGLTPARPLAQVEHDSDDESSGSEFSRSSTHTPTVLSSRTRVLQPAMTTPSPARPLSAVDYTRALANNGLSHPFSPPPLLHIANSPLFPRSCNTHSQVSSLMTGSLRTQLFQNRVLARLSHPSRADEQTLQRFAGKYQPQPKGPHLHLDDNAVSGRVCARSEGLRRWVDRPCFEDRLAVYRPAEQGEECEPDMEGIVCVPVSGTILGVAALEFSEHLENLAGLYDDFAEDMTVTADAETDAATEVTFTLTTSPTLELPKAQEIPASIEFPRRLSQDLHAAPALNVDVGVGGLGELIDFERKLTMDSSPPQLTPPLSLTSSSVTSSPTSSGPPTPTGTLLTGAAAGNANDVKEGVKGDAGSRTPGSSPQQPSGILSSSQQRQQPYKAMPSPLRMESNMLLPNPYSPVKPSSISGSSTSSTSPTPSTSTSTATVTLQATSPRPQQKQDSPRPAVRFAPSTKGKDSDESTSDSDASENDRQKRKDTIPLGYVQRIKQQRLEKQRFLAAERARRAQAEEVQRRAAQAKAEEEARIRAERRREDEERRRRMYQEEVIAARSRRESTKFVSPQLSMSGSAVDVTIGAGAASSSALAARGREREKAETYPRPVYDQRRGSESSQARSSVSRTRDVSRDPPPVPPLPTSPSIRNASPAPSGSGSGSQRGSSAHSHLAPPHPAALASGSRSTSAPDVRPRDRSASSSRGAANRSSMADSSLGGRDRTSSNPNPGVSSPSSQMWMTSPMMGMSPNMNMNMNMNMQMNRMSMMGVPMMAVPMAVPVAVPVHGYPMSPMQMGMEPLLPPTPPFVMQQFGYRPPSQNSHRDSSASSGQRRSHSSSPTPPTPRHHSKERSEPRSHSSSPTVAREQKASFPPSSGQSAVRASQHYPPAPLPSPSSSRPVDYSHHRRSSADMDLHRRSNLQAPPVTATRSERGEPSRDHRNREDRRASKVPPVPSPSSRSSRPQPYHSSSMPSPASPSSPPAIVVDRTSRPVSGFQILSRPAQQRRQTIIS
ncbi:uncharacterized protein C8Q71DRAFT_852780 [Rhodofomes roseus]|uniref:Uncharacterized protein n=1 Tax=Rhodofomes roseus TaxID=34475 RepID=A0ABQ8L052_9APHY|nr:uncharacterized protein C8Q71DRAFT_852780 [Rhodofomes roseus]KAH9844281.1 hypothetical protein C8Q71DRAFT_852780 [Rhodofomes roseus]